MDDLIGQIINNFEVQEVIGKGGMGIVYRGYHPDLQTSAAIKILRPDMARQPDFYKRFLQEARTAARLNHPNIINVLNFGQHGEYYYLMMEYISGPSLRQLIVENEGGMPLWDVVQIFLQIADVMAFAHDEGVLHRDLKPDNILLTNSVRATQPYRAIVTDFGLVKLAENSIMETQKGFSVGTPAYMAPEQIRGQPLDGRSDLYAIGVMMYECITGKRPYPIRTHFDAAKYHAKGEVVPLRTRDARVPVQLDNLVNRLLSVEVKHRPVNAREVVVALERLVLELDPQRDVVDSQIQQRITSQTNIAIEDMVKGDSTQQDVATAAGYVVQIFFEGKPEDRTFALEPGKLLVGRQDDVDIKLSDLVHKSVSRHHCEIVYQGDRILVRDLRSTNGTFLRGERLQVNQFYEWPVGQRLLIGPGPFSLALIPVVEEPVPAADEVAQPDSHDRTMVATNTIYLVCKNAVPSRLPIVVDADYYRPAG